MTRKIPAKPLQLIYVSFVIGTVCGRRTLSTTHLTKMEITNAPVVARNLRGLMMTRTEKKESGMAEKIYVLCSRGRIGSMEFEEVMQACSERDRDKLIEYASKYHFDVMSDPDDMGYYRGLVIYECSWGEDPYEYWGTSEG
jgi:hypothetical protein